MFSIGKMACLIFFDVLEKIQFKEALLQKYKEK